MIDESAAVLPMWMLLSAAFGFIIGDAFGDSRRHRKCLEQANEDLRDELEKTRIDREPLHRELKQQRGVINDIHKQVTAVTKPSRNALPKSNKINGRISPIRPYQKVYLQIRKRRARMTASTCF
jgi:hypothetical protein